MSRSYKKHPYCTDGHARSTKLSKRYANKAVRNTKYDAIPLKGCGYKKVYESWDIHDWIERYTRQEWIIRYNNPHIITKKTLAEELNLWEKYYRRK